MGNVLRIPNENVGAPRTRYTEADFVRASEVWLVAPSKSPEDSHNEPSEQTAVPDEVEAARARVRNALEASPDAA